MKIAIVAGEASGDLLAAELMICLLKEFPDAQFIGMGGPRMQAQGLQSWFDYSALSIMGIVEVLKHLPKLLKLRKQLTQRIISEKPDVLIGVDAPDFNFGLEQKCKSAGIKTVHFVSPSIWAWREGRAKKMSNICDLMLCLFPMEPALYAAHHVNAKYVGHPLADRIVMNPIQADARKELALGSEALLAILPGSRLSEIEKLLPVFLAAFKLLQKNNSKLHGIIPAANEKCRALIEQQLYRSQAIQLRVIDGQAQTAMIASDAVLLASGTASLEAMLCKRPMLVAYKISAITHAIVNGLGILKVKYFSLPNALAGKEIVPEFMQENCTPEKIAAALQNIFDQPEKQQELQTEYVRIHQLLKQNAAEQAASAIKQLIHTC